MAEHVIFHDCLDETKRRIEEYWRQKTPRIERLLQHFPDDQRHLRLSIRRHPKRYEAHVSLRLPTGTLVAEASGRDSFEALDIVADRLAAEIRRHREVIRRDDAYRRKRARPAIAVSAAAPLAAHKRTKDNAAFLELLQPILLALRDHAHRELVLAQLQDRIKPGELSVSELLDETAALAWERFDSRPADRPIDQWLVELLHEALDDREREPVAMVSLEERLPDDDARYEADTGWTAENALIGGRPAPLTLDEVLPSYRAPEPWQEIAAEEQRRWILRQLRRFPRRQGRALMLYALEGWDEEDIAMLQGRTAGEVRADIEGARRTLQERAERLDEAGTIAQ